MTDNFHRFKINLPLVSNNATIEIDGKPLKGVTGIGLMVGVGELVELRLTIIGHVEIDGQLTESEFVHVERKQELPSANAGSGEG